MQIRRMIALAVGLVLTVCAGAWGDVAINETNFPDSVFRSHVSSSYDTDSDNVLSDAEIAAVTNISVQSMGISSLKGVEYFTALTSLYCDFNQLTELDVSKNTALEDLGCYNNQLASLDVSHNTALTGLRCQDNQLTSLDVSKNTALTGLLCYNNQLTSLDVSKNTVLEVLYCDNNQLTALDVSHNTALTQLLCNSNQLTVLDVNNNTALINLECGDNQLTALDVTKNTALTFLWCPFNQLTALDVSRCASLDVLRCDSNDLTELDVTKNAALTNLNCGTNQLTELDVTKNTALTELYCDNNQLTELDVTKNTALTNLNCGGNQLTVLDVTKNTALTRFECGSNQLTELDVSHNTALTNLNCGSNQLTALDLSNNPDLTSLLCDKNQLTVLDVTKNVSLDAMECGSNQLTSLDVTKNTALTGLWCNDNQLTALDVTKNTALTLLWCNDNPLTKLDVTQNTKLETLGCDHDYYLTELDLSQNTALIKLHCGVNQLTALDLSHNPALTELGCNDNDLVTLNVSNCASLDILVCYNNLLTSLDVTHNPVLTQLWCSDNALTELNLASNTILTSLRLGINKLTKLDVSKNPALTDLQCNDNRLAELDVSNCASLDTFSFSSQFVSTVSPDTTGDSSYPYSLSFSALSTSLDISRVYSLDVTDYYGSSVSYTTDSSAGKWLFTSKPKTLTYNYYTGHSGSYMDVTATLAGAGVPLLAADSANFPDSAFRSYITSYLDTNADSCLSTTELAAVTSLNLQGLGISDLTGIENFTNLQILDCTSNALTALDLTANTALVSLDCSNNQLVSLDVSQCPNLLELYCDNNQLTTLDVSQNTLLQILSCAYNYLTGLNLTANSDLQLLSCTSNDIASINLTANTQLQTLSIGSNDLQAVDLTANTQLQVLEVYGNNLTSLDVSGLASLFWLNCMDNSLARLDLTSNTGLMLSYFSGQNLTVNSPDETGTSDFPYSIALTDIYSGFTQNDFSRIDSIDAVTFGGSSMDTYIDESDGIVYFSRRPGTMTYYYSTGKGSMDVKASFSTTGIVPITEDYFPDSVFRSYISTNFDVDGDNILNDAEIAEVNSIIVQDMGISTLQGIEHFSALTYLNCDSNQLTALDISKNSALTGLYCHSNQLTALDVTQNSYLTDLDCLSNQLTELNVTQNSYLSYFNCGDNLLTELDVTNNSALMLLYCWNNQLTELDVTQNPQLTMLECNTNQLTELNVSGNTELKALYCSKNKIEALDLSRNTKLISLLCDNNALGALDLSANVSLDTSAILEVATPGSIIYYDLSSSDFSAQAVSCDSPDVTGTAPYSYSLNFSAINASFDASRAYSLDVTDYNGSSVTCSADTSTGKLLFTAKPKTMNYSYYTGHSGSYMGVTATLAGGAEEAFALSVSPSSATITPGSSAVFTLTPENALGPVAYGYAPFHSWVTFSGDIAIAAPTTEGTYTLTITAADSGRGSSNTASVSVAVTVSVPSSWTAITESAFPDSALRSYLTGKYDSEGIGYLTSSDIASVTSLNLSGLGIADLTGIETFTALVSLDCSGNNLTGTLDLSANTALVYLDCSENFLTALNVNGCTLLETLRCYSNDLSELDVTNNSALEVLFCWSNGLTELDLSSNTGLISLDCGYCRLTALDVSMCEDLRSVVCYGNYFPILDLSSNSALVKAFCDTQSLTLSELDTTGQYALPYSISLNAAKSALGLSIDIADFAANVSELEILDANGTITHSTDIASGTVYFSGKPELITYIYNTGYQGSGTSMDVAVTISSDAQAPNFSVTLNPSSQTITQGDSITAIIISYVMGSGDISYTSESLPSGLTLSVDRITGAISAAGTYTFTVNATDAEGQTAAATASVTVEAPYSEPSGITGISITSPAAKTITLSADGGTFSAAISAEGEANGSIVWTASATQGLTASITGSGSTAALSGTAQPNTSSQDISGTITITAHDGIGSDYTDTLTVIVSGMFISEDIISPDVSPDISIDVTITGIAFSPETVTLSADGGSVTVTAQIQGTPSGDVTWSVVSGDFSVSPQRGTAVTITGTAAPNTTSYDITQTVRISAADSVKTVSGDFTVIVAGIGSGLIISGDITSKDIISGDIASGDIISGDQTESGDHSGGGGENNPNDDPRPYYEKYTGDTWDDAYVMGSYSDFINLLERFINGSESEGKYYAINSDLDLSAVANFQSIGSESQPFKGHFNGNGRTITIPANSRGLFGLVDADGIAIQNLNVRTGFSLYNGASGGTPPSDYAGGIVQELVRGTITGCTFTGTVTADGTDSAAGGIVGLLSGGNVQNCRVLSGSGIYASYSAGGIVGYVMAGNISGCTSDADVEAEFSGGIAGYTESERRNIASNTFTVEDFEVGNDILSIVLLPASQRVRAGDAITDIVVSSDNAAAWSFMVSGDYALGLTSRDMTISGRIPAGTQAHTYTLIVNAVNINGFTASARASITVTGTSSAESGDISGNISGDSRPGGRPGTQNNTVHYVFEIPSAVRERASSRFTGETIYQFTADEIFSGTWELDTADSKAIADLYENVVLYLPILRPQNTGLYMLRLDLSGAGAGKKIKLYGVTSGGGNVMTAVLEDMNYVLLDENGNEVTEVPENGIVYAALRLTANREHRGVVTVPIELELGTIQPVKAEELGNTVLERIAETVKVSADNIKFIKDEDISEPQEPTQAIRSELESRQNRIIGKFNTLNVKENGYYVFKVTLSDDLYEQVKGVSINELNVYALYDDGRTERAEVRASFISGLVSTWELLSLNGEKLEFGVKEFLMVGFLNAGTPFSVYLTKLIIMLLLGGCDSGVGIAGFAAIVLVAGFLILRRKH